MASQLPHDRHAADLAYLDQKIGWFAQAVKANPNSVQAAKDLGEAQASRRHTGDRLAHATRAADVVDKLGLTDEVTPHTVTRADAANYLAKVAHEIQHGLTASHYARAHGHLRGIRTPHPDKARAAAGEMIDHADPAMLDAPWDPAAEAIEHLGLTDPQHRQAVLDFIAACKPAVAPTAQELVAKRGK